MVKESISMSFFPHQLCHRNYRSGNRSEKRTISFPKKNGTVPMYVQEIVMCITFKQIITMSQPDQDRVITQEDFQNAAKLIRDYYNQDFSKLHGHDRPCICCEKKFKSIHPDTTRFPQQGMYEHGVVDKIAAG